jgi:ATP-dependent DNA helicase RecQ
VPLVIALQSLGSVSDPRARARERSAVEVEGPSDDLERLLADRFGLSSFRPWQREAIEALLRPPGHVLLVAPTGGGKSLCYQLPALALDGTALVLSPLISLMEDQVRSLEARGIPATFIASSLPREENGRRIGGLRRGAYKIVYAAPERLAYDGFLDALGASHLSLVAVDEAHCIVQWGHDFRPDYLRIGDALARLRPPRVLACTATATLEARSEILRQLGPYGEDCAVVLRGFARPNLHLAVQEVSGPTEARAFTIAELDEALGSRRSPKGAGIVYAATRKSTERLAEQLVEAGFQAEAYHAGLDASVRARVSARFASRELPVVVATNAFGMGIDRPDVRVVVHAQPPSSIEAYYQEVGRAGRDGEPAHGLLLLAPSDIALRRRMSTAGADGSPAPVAEAARAWAMFRELLRYVDAGTCRHDFILRYFGDEAESLGGCGHCDVCLATALRHREDPGALARDVDTVRRALAGVARAKGSAGMQAVASMLRGERSDRLARLGLDRLSTFGVLADRSADEIGVVLRVLVAAGWVDLAGTEFPVPVVTESGWRVMVGEAGCEVRLPDARPPSRAPRVRKRERDGARPKPTKGASRVEPKASKASAGDAALFASLRAHRAEVARELEVPAYVVAPDRTLSEIAALRPRTMDDLRAAHGMGPQRAAAYGDGFLRVVREHAEG